MAVRFLVPGPFTMMLVIEIPGCTARLINLLCAARARRSSSFANKILASFDSP